MCTSFISLGPRSAPPPASLVALGSPRTPISCYAPSPSKQTLPRLWPLSATFGSSSSFLPVPSCVTQAGSFLSRRPFVPISLPVPLLERLPLSIHPVCFAPGHLLPCFLDPERHLPPPSIPPTSRPRGLVQELPRSTSPPSLNRFDEHTHASRPPTVSPTLSPSDDDARRRSWTLG